jgi:uncharacterized membrane protein
MLPIRIAGGQWRQQWWWLLLWILLGASLRLTNLDGKPPWTDEFRTLVLTIGNSFQSIPLDRAIDIRDLLAPLVPNPSMTVSDIIQRVTIEDRQPPIYFVLAHLWMKMFPPEGGLVNLWGARALPAGLGILAIPCGYICSYFTFRSGQENDRSARMIANFTAAMLAVSPYGIFISQEARHYSLAILWMMISINCLAIACRYLARSQKLPISLTIVWVTVNIVGIGTHYFFCIALIAEFMALGAVWWWQFRQIKRTISLNPCWRQLLVAMLGTAAGGAVWWWQLTSTYDRSIHAWIDNAPHKLIEVFNPFFQAIGAMISMMSLLLVEVTEFPPASILSESPIDINIPIVFLSAILMLMFFAWAMPMLKRGVKIQLRQPQTQIGTIAIASFTVSSIGLYLVIPWLTGIDITRGARYHFVYFPGIMMLIGLGLASCWQAKPSIAKWVSGQQAVTIVLVMGLVSSTIVANNYGYHKYYRPEQMIPMIQQSAPIPVLIATTHNSLVQVGEMMGLAWELRRQGLERTLPTQFLLASQFQKFCDRESTTALADRDCAATTILRETVDRIPHSIDLWLVNFYAPVSLPPTCERDKKFVRGVYGYQYQLYHCQPIKDVDA